jgi:hypothetical protein
MQTDTIVVAAMMAAFIVFAVTLYWADHRTRELGK